MLRFLVRLFIGRPTSVEAAIRPLLRAAEDLIAVEEDRRASVIRGEKLIEDVQEQINDDRAEADRAKAIVTNLTTLLTPDASPEEV